MMANHGNIAEDTLFEPERLAARAIDWDRSDRGLHQGAQPPCCNPDAVYMAATDITPASPEKPLPRGSHPYMVRAQWRAPAISANSKNSRRARLQHCDSVSPLVQAHWRMRCVQARGCGRPDRDRQSRYRHRPAEHHITRHWRDLLILGVETTGEMDSEHGLFPCKEFDREKAPTSCAVEFE